MSAIPPFSCDDVAKRSDLDRLATHLEFAEFRGEMRSEFAEFRGLMQSEFAEFRGMMQSEFAEFRGMMQSEFAEFRGMMQSEFAEFRGMIQSEFPDFRSQMHALISKGQMSLLFRIAAMNLSTAGIIIVALKFLG